MAKSLKEMTKRKAGRNDVCLSIIHGCSVTEMWKTS